MSYQRMLETLDKAEFGPIYDEKEFEKIQIGAAVQDVIRKFEITWSNDVRVPSDDALADRLFEAGLALAAESGLFCMDTKRRMIWGRDELLDILDETSPQIKLGTGDDEISIMRRHPDEDSYIVIGGGPYGIPVPEEMFIPVVQSYVQERSLDYFEGPILATVYGRPVRDGSPWEAVWCWQEKKMVMEGLELVGRPNMAVGAEVGSASYIGELSSTTYDGFRLTDKHHLVFTSELKVTYAELTKAVHLMQVGAAAEGYFNPIFGGYGGAFLPLGSTALFVINITAGRGWLAIVLVIAGNWIPWRIMVAALIFAFLDAFQLQAQGLGVNIPFQIMLALPYVAAIIAMMTTRSRSVAPAALGVPYARE